MSKILGGTKFFVGGLQMHCTETDLREAFAKYGSLKEVLVMRDHKNGNKSRGFGFVHFQDKVELIPNGQTSVVGYQVLGRNVEIKFASPRSEQEANEMGVSYTKGKGTVTPPPQSRSVDMHMAVAQGFPKEATEGDIQTYFKMFGSGKR